jgi:sec-independent protein translocase protein TatC
MTLPSDPEEVRMTLGEHLEDLRWRLFRAIGAIAIGMLVAFLFSDQIMKIFVQPYLIAARWQGESEYLQALEPAEVVIVILKMSLLVGILISSPYAFYQIWAFVAAGLYPRERRVVTRMVPASVGLFAAGVLFLFYIVLPLALRFLLAANSWVPMPSGQPNSVVKLLLGSREGVVAASTQPVAQFPEIPVLDEDPVNPRPRTVWVNQQEAKLKIFLGKEQTLVSDLHVQNRAMVESHFNLSGYVSFVTGMSLAFGLTFQVPLVVMLLSRVGIVSAAQMGKARRGIILAVLVLAAILSPSPDVYNQLLVAVPMLLLFEIGLFLAGRAEKRNAALSENEQDGGQAV